MKKHSNPAKDQNSLRDKIIGLGETSIRKSYYPELQKKLSDLERFKILLDQINDGICVIEIATGKIIDINHTAANLIGYHDNEVIGMTINEILGNDYEARLRAFLKENKSNPNYIFSTDFINRNGKNTPLEISLRSVEFNEILYVIIVARDISERILAEENIKRFKFIVDHSGEEFYLSDTSGNFTYVNEAATKSLGYTLDEMMKLGVPGIDPDYNRVRYKELFQDLKQKELPPFETYQIAKNGKRIPKEIKAVYVKIGNDEYLCSFARDITVRKLAEEKLRFLSRAVAQSPSSIVITDLSGNIVYINPKFTQITGYNENEIIGKNIRLMKSGETPESEYQKLWSAITSGKEWKGEFRNRKKNGELYWELATISPITDDKGKTTHFVAILEDITERKLAEQNLIKAKELAEKSDRLKTEFLAQMSHEIRTPINTILSFSSLIKEEVEDKIDDELKSKFKIIENGSRRLIRTIDLILNMSQVQTGTIDIYPVEIDLQEILQNIMIDLHFAANERKLNLVFKNKDDIKEKVKADRYSINQIFINLLENAIKYSTKDDIEILLYKDKNQICVDIKDSGIGISEEYLNIIFSPFSQEDTGYTRRFEGTGLGLALVKKYCDLNNIEISVKSKKGEGTTFTTRFQPLDDDH